MNYPSISAALGIVHLEDKPQDRELIADALAAEGIIGNFTYAKTKEEFQAALEQRGIGLILCDYSVPSYSGSEALSMARRLKPEVPFIFVSGTIGEDRAVESVRSGATDYVLKEHLDRLSPVVHRALQEAQLQRQQKQSEEAMRTSEHKYRHLFESLSDAAFLISEQTGKIIDTNPQANVLLGRTRCEIIGWLEGQLYPPDGVSASGCGWVACACQTRGGCETMVLNKDGTEVPVHVSASRLELHGHWVFLALFRDLTERKQLERQFLRAQRLESIGTLAGGVAHDLNNILAPILMVGPILSQEVKSPTGQQLLTTVETCARRGAELVKQLTTFARGLDGEKGPFQSSHLLREVCKIVTETFPKAIQLKYQIPTDLWIILGVPTQIHQVLLNLTVNARDAMPEGGCLTLAAENIRLDEAAARLIPGAKAGPFVVFRIADTGTGIAPEIADLIFDPFFTTKGPDRGTGLGLSTVVGIVKSHGGFIQFTSLPAQGTEFRVYLPASVDAAAAQGALPTPPLPRGHGELVLIVDDEAALRSVMQRTLQTHGYRTLTAHNGAQAVSLYSNMGQDISLVITDLDMPSLGGRATAAALLSINPKVKIVVATGLDSLPKGGFDIPVGCRALLKKPCETGLLLQTVDQVLRGERRSPENVL
jgi:two-component system cell cycle sensor histidine kinase/response regulator CckA